MATGPKGNDFKSKMAEMSERFTLGQKVMIGGATVAVFFAIMMLSKAAGGGEDLTSLYSNLKPADAAAVTEKLTTEGTPYKLTDGGATIMVDRAKVYDLRLKMAADGLPQQGPEGYALLDKQGITTSEFSQQVGYQRAMEGELAKTITAMDPVETATVHLAIPKSDVFAGESAKASASVLVKPRAGKALDPMQVQAIVHLVASSVQDLAPESVTVADSSGNVLAAPGEDGSALNAADLNTRQRGALEKGMSSSIQQLIEPVVGAGKVKVTVSADMDYSKKSSTSEKFEQPSGDPNKVTRVSEAGKTEVYKGGATGTGGTIDITDPANANGVANGGTDYNLTSTDARNALNRTVEETKNQPGEIKRMNVAVLLDSGASNADQIAQIQNLVSAAAGLDPTRGDKVEVSRLPFDNGIAEAAKKEMETLKAAEAQAATMGTARQAGVVVLLLIILVLVYRSIRKAARRQPPDLYAVEVRKLEQARRNEQLAYERQILELSRPMSVPKVQLSEEDLKRESTQQQVEEMIDQQPAEVAQMLRTWLGEGKAGAKR